MSPLTSRRSVRPGLDNRFLLGGPPVKIGQVGITSVGRMWSLPCIVVMVIVLYFELGFQTSAMFLNSVVCIQTFYVTHVL